MATLKHLMPTGIEASGEKAAGQNGRVPPMKLEVGPAVRETNKIRRIALRVLNRNVANSTGSLASDEDALDDVSVYVGQPAADAVVIEGQLFVIESEQMQRCGVEVIDGDRVFGRLVA